MPLSTIVAIWKPKGPTSHDVVDAVRRITDERRVGHAGTLDPIAEGVLVVGIGREATKRLASIVSKEKEYIATIALGATSTTDDAEGEIISAPSLRGAEGDVAISSNTMTEIATRHAAARGCASLGCLARDDINRILHQFLGRIEQVPPAYSAVKLKGTPAYKLARRGDTPDLKPRLVEIKTIELLDYAPPRAGKHRQASSPEVEFAPAGASGEAHRAGKTSGVETPADVEGLEGGTLTLRVVCGPGTYIRALARDIGRVLGIGGYLTALTRTRVGTHTKENALTLEEFRNRWPHIATEY